MSPGFQKSQLWHHYNLIWDEKTKNVIRWTLDPVTQWAHGAKLNILILRSFMDLCYLPYIETHAIIAGALL